MQETTYTLTGNPPEDEECHCVEISAPPIFYLESVEDFAPSHYAELFCTEDGIRAASRRHDAMARRKYVKPFKWFKFNRARKATAK